MIKELTQKAGVEVGHTNRSHQPFSISFFQRSPTLLPSACWGRRTFHPFDITVTFGPMQQIHVEITGLELSEAFIDSSQGWFKTELSGPHFTQHHDFRTQRTRRINVSKGFTNHVFIVVSRSSVNQLVFMIRNCCSYDSFCFLSGKPSGSEPNKWEVHTIRKRGALVRICFDSSGGSSTRKYRRSFATSCESTAIEEKVFVF
mmetsp:Transcript_27904/g.43261  ORF Transcript_27904/g.43261 Transcript_27904/m.43261 type:complete len:202 (-) Transcript_27904:771-1376(-)